MKTWLPLLLFGLLWVSARAAEPNDQLPPAPRGQTWKLTWQDEFDGDKLDGTKWEVPDNKRRDGWWSPKAVSLDGKGHLAISTLNDGDRYLDACVRTRGKFEHAHGYYVARIKLQEQPGHWSAFWLYNSSRVVVVELCCPIQFCKRSDAAPIMPEPELRKKCGILPVYRQTTASQIIG